MLLICDFIGTGHRSQPRFDLVIRYTAYLMASLPPFILNGWRLQCGEERRAKAAQQLKDFTTSSLAEAMMKFQLDKHFNNLERSTSAPSLAYLAVGTILDTLAISDDLEDDMKTVAKYLNSTILRQLLDDPRTPYPLLSKLLTLPETLAAQDRRTVDVDEAVLRNERYIRSRDSNQDGRYLVSLEDLSEMLSGFPQDDHSVSFKRKDPPKGGLEFLDETRKRELSIQPSSSSFCKVFERITRGALRGLDWSHVFVAGGMALTTLLHTDPSKDDDRAVRDPDIDIYIYGLGPEDANRKVEEIHDIWVRSLPATAQRLVVKSSKTINLLSSYPHRRLQIVLKLLAAPTDVLLNFDLDACAIGFDGSRVLMLPRCARAIETGYSVFTMDLVWGHHLSERRASQEIRIFKYADRGFGLRILPSYVQSLELSDLEAAVFKNFQSPTSAEHRIDDADPKAWTWSQRDRKPFGNSEPGLKTLKRIAYLGQDFIRRFVFGATPLTISQEEYKRQRDLQDPSKRGTEHVVDQVRQDEWQKLFDQSARHQRKLEAHNERKRALGEDLEKFNISLATLDTSGIHRGLPDGRKGLGNFEIFMRHCEVWRLHALGQARLIGSVNATSLAYDPRTYDDFPDYPWDETFSIDTLETEIETDNNRLWGNVKKAICYKLGIPFASAGCESLFLHAIYCRDIVRGFYRHLTLPSSISVMFETKLVINLQPIMLGTIGCHHVFSRKALHNGSWGNRASSHAR